MVSDTETIEAALAALDNASPAISSILRAASSSTGTPSDGSNRFNLAATQAEASLAALRERVLAAGDVLARADASYAVDPRDVVRPAERPRTRPAASTSHATLIIEAAFKPQHASPTTTHELVALCSAMSKHHPALRIVAENDAELASLTSIPRGLRVEVKGVLRARLVFDRSAEAVIVSRAQVCGWTESIVDRFGTSDHRLFQQITLAVNTQLDRSASNLEATLSMLALYSDLFAPVPCVARPCRASAMDQLAPAPWRVWASLGAHASPQWLALHKTCAQLYI